MAKRGIFRTLKGDETTRRRDQLVNRCNLTFDSASVDSMTESMSFVTRKGIDCFVTTRGASFSTTTGPQKS